MQLFIKAFKQTTYLFKTTKFSKCTNKQRILINILIHLDFLPRNIGFCSFYVIKTSNYLL